MPVLSSAVAGHAVSGGCDGGHGGLLLSPVPHGCCVGGQKEGGGGGGEDGGAQKEKHAAEAMERDRLLLEKRRKRKKRRKKKLPRTSSPRSSGLARQRVRVHASVFEAALLRSAWFNSGYMYLLRFCRLFGRIPLHFNVKDPVFSVPLPRYPAVTCSVSASHEEYKRTGVSGRRLHIFLQPLVSGSHLFSVCLACGTGKLVSLGDDFFHDPVFLTVTCSVLLRLRVQVHGFKWELTSGYSFRIHHFLVRQRIHVSASPRGYVEEFHTFFYVFWDLGFRGRYRVLFTPGNLECVYELLISGSLASTWWLLDEFLPWIPRWGTCCGLSGCRPAQDAWHHGPFGPEIQYGSGMFMAGYAGFALYSLWFSTGPRCSASWPVWTKRIVTHCFYGRVRRRQRQLHGILLVVLCALCSPCCRHLSSSTTVACTRLVLLMMLQFSLCSFRLSASLRCWVLSFVHRQGRDELRWGFFSALYTGTGPGAVSTGTQPP